MSFYPINLNIKDKHCLVVGGGNVALRKVQTLLSFGAQVRVVSPQVCRTLEALASGGQISLIKRSYASSDIESTFLVFAAANNEDVQKLVAADAKKHNVLLNSATEPDICDFQVPAHFKRGDLQIAISTAGASPAVSKMLREKLESSFGDEYEHAICLLRLIRQRLVTSESCSDENKLVLNSLLQKDMIGCIGRNHRAELKTLLEQNLPEKISVEDLLDEFYAVCMV